MRKYIEIQSADDPTKWYKLRFLNAGWRSPIVNPNDVQRALDGSGSLSIGSSYHTWSGTAKVKWTEDADYATPALVKKWSSSKKTAERDIKIRTFYYDIAGHEDYQVEYPAAIRNPWDPEHIIPAHDQGFAYVPLQIEEM